MTKVTFFALTLTRNDMSVLAVWTECVLQAVIIPFSIVSWMPPL